MNMKYEEVFYFTYLVHSFKICTYHKEKFNYCKSFPIRDLEYFVNIILYLYMKVYYLLFKKRI